MALLMLRDLLEDRPTAFDFGLYEDELSPKSIIGPVRLHLRRPWRQHSRQAVSKIHGDKDAFKVNLDVQQFRPDEISVKTVNDFIVVEAKHEEKEDEHGFVSRQFTRKYKLPKDCEPETVVSSLSSDGVLTISAPKKKKLPPNVKEIIVPIQQTQAPAVREQEMKPEGDKKQDKMKQ